MKFNKRIAYILLLVMTTTILLASCGGKTPTTLEEYVVANQSEQDAIQGIVSDDPNATVSINENTMDITYKVDDKAMTADILNTALDSLGDSFSGIIKDLEAETGIQGIKIKVTYLDASEKEITSKLFG